MNGGTLLNVVGPSEKQYMGKPCKRGHSGLRYKSGNKPCVECAREWHKNMTPEQIEKKRERSRERRRVENMTPEQIEKERKRSRERKREQRRRQEEEASAKRRRLAKISRLAEHPEASPAEREVARRKLALLNERMIHELGQRH